MQTVGLDIFQLYELHEQRCRTAVSVQPMSVPLAGADKVEAGYEFKLNCSSTPDWPAASHSDQ
jgi:hypothetical protein